MQMASNGLLVASEAPTTFKPLFLSRFCLMFLLPSFRTSSQNATTRHWSTHLSPRRQEGGKIFMGVGLISFNQTLFVDGSVCYEDEKMSLQMSLVTLSRFFEQIFKPVCTKLNEMGNTHVAFAINMCLCTNFNCAH